MTLVAAWFFLVCWLDLLLVPLKMEAISLYEVFVHSYRTTRRYHPEDSIGTVVKTSNPTHNGNILPTFRRNALLSFRIEDKSGKLMLYFAARWSWRYYLRNVCKLLPGNTATHPSENLKPNRFCNFQMLLFVDYEFWEMRNWDRSRGILMFVFTLTQDRCSFLDNCFRIS